MKSSHRSAIVPDVRRPMVPRHHIRFQLSVLRHSSHRMNGMPLAADVQTDCPPAVYDVTAGTRAGPV